MVIVMLPGKDVMVFPGAKVISNDPVAGAGSISAVNIASPSKRVTSGISTV